jgi:hypothetical protein
MVGVPHNNTEHILILLMMNMLFASAPANITTSTTLFVSNHSDTDSVQLLSRQQGIH